MAAATAQVRREIITLATALSSSQSIDRSANVAGQNLSFILEGIHQVKFEDRPIPELKNPHDVLINVKYTGICGSDVGS